MTSPFRFDTIGIPVINNETMIRSSARGVMSETHLIINTIITSLIFINLLLFFTFAFNLSTRGTDSTDYLFLQFTIYFTVFNFFFVSFLLIWRREL